MIKKINKNNLRKSRFLKISPLIQLGIIGNGVFLAGGALRTLIDERECISDFDVFFETDLEDPSSSRLEEVKKSLEKERFELVFVCPEGKLFTYKKNEIKIQLILMKFMKPEDMIKTFDFGACQVAFDGEDLFFSKAFVRNVMTKTLSTEFVEFPVATINRLIKYQEKGYNIKTAIKEFIISIQGLAFDEESLALYID